MHRVLSRIDVDDLEGARDALSRLSAFRKNFKEGSRNQPRRPAGCRLRRTGAPARRVGRRRRRHASAWRRPTAINSARTGSSTSPKYELLHGSAEDGAPGCRCLPSSRSRPAWTCAPRSCHRGWR